MELLQQILAAFQGIPPAAIIIFLIVSVVIAVELWRLRPQRERPPVPTPPDLPAQAGAPPPPTGQEQSAVPTPPGEFKPLTTQQIAALALLLILVVAIPAGVLLYQKVRTPAPPSGTPMPIVKQPTATPKPTPRRRPKPTLRPTAPPAPKPTRTPRPTATPLPTKKPLATASPGTTKGGLRQNTSSSASASALPQYKKPGKLPGAGTSILIAPLLGGAGLLLIGLKKLLEKAKS